MTPTVKHLFSGFDVTIFAYGSTGTGKTHTMRGGKSLADRGMIPRLLSSIYRQGRKIEKESDGDTAVEVSMSYYEIYNDRIHDLFEGPEKRTTTGLPLRECGGGKTVVVGLTEVPCRSIKEFEGLYDVANANRSTSATKLNAHSSRSHAILCVKVTMAGPTETRVSCVSAIDLAGSEDNRRTGNDKERMVESASINKSLFVLAQCVEAISKKQQRIPYRESKMTRILSLGQNNGFTVMILNLAPVRSYHLDTLSSLNFANRTKRIEVREVENEPLIKGPPRAVVPLAAGANMQRQPLRPLNAGINLNIGTQQVSTKSGDKPPKTFAVWSDKTKFGTSRPNAQARTHYPPQNTSPLKRGADTTTLPSARPAKTLRPTPTFLRRLPEQEHSLSKASIEEIVEKKVCEVLAARTLEAPVEAPAKGISEEVQHRLDSIEQRLEGQEGARAEGLSYLLMAKQHQARGEDSSALRMYQLAVPYFPANEKLGRKIVVLQDKLRQKRERKDIRQPQQEAAITEGRMDATYASCDGQEESECDSDDASVQIKATKRSRAPRRVRVSSPDPLAAEDHLTPRTSHLLDIINARDISQIKMLKGVGVKRAKAMVGRLDEMDEENGARQELVSLRQLEQLRGVGTRTVESMRSAVLV